MAKWMKVLSVVAVVTAMLLATTGLVLSSEDTHIYGLIFVDTNGNGVFDAGEQGYAGAKVVLNPGDPDEAIELETASSREPEEGEEDLCTYQDYISEDGPDEDEEPDVTENPMRPCVGTFGLRPAGPKEMIWEVTLTPPSGYVATSPNPVYVEITSDTPWVDIGIAPVGAGGPVAAAPVLLPVTGEALIGFLAFAALLVGGSAFAVGRRSRR